MASETMKDANSKVNTHEVLTFNKRTIVFLVEEAKYSSRAN